MQNELKLFSLNTFNCHLLQDKILPLLEVEKPDVVMLQEMWQDQVPLVANAIGADALRFSTLCHLDLTGSNDPKNARPWGLAIVSRGLLIHETTELVYKGGEPEINLDNRGATRRTILSIEGNLAGTKYQLATTHFTLHSRGQESEEQVSDMIKMTNTLISRSNPSLVLAGDFNLDRNTSPMAWSMLSALLTDHLPDTVTSTYDAIDIGNGKLSKDWGKVADGIFADTSYVVRGVELLPSGLSDHRGVRANII